MDDITILITGAGAPGIKGTLYSLNNNFDKRVIHTIGTDIRKEVVGKFLCDKYFQISKAADNSYVTELLTICERESVDVILPQNTMELSVLAKNRKKFEAIGTAIVISNPKSISIANNKSKLLRFAEGIGVPVPKFFQISKASSLIKYAKILGWPDCPIVVKPPVSNGMRGVRIINESLDYKKMFYEENRPHYT